MTFILIFTHRMLFLSNVIGGYENTDFHIRVTETEMCNSDNGQGFM